MVLLAALLCRLLWVSLFQGEIGGDAIRYLWIAEHVRRGQWHLLPQLFSSPLLPVSIGLLSRLTGDPVLAAKWIGVIMNTLAVGFAILGQKGLAVEALRAADLVVGRVEDALDLLLHPQRLVATLRL